MTDDRDARLDRACAEYLRAADAGRTPDRAAWLAAHPDIAGDLSEFLAGLGAVEGLLAPLRDDANATVDRRAAVTDPDTPTAPDGYELLGPIAAGGMGVVYRARQVAVKREVALKMIRAGVLAGESTVQRFRREAEAAAGFDHPHIVPVYEVGVTAGGQPFFSMKLIDGRTLSDWLADGRASGLLDTTAGLRLAVRLLAAVCRAVHYAHQRGFLHRDLKPANVLVDAAGVPHVTDFGLAKRVGERPSDAELTEAGGLVGTLAYMPPEQARGERLTTAADVYPLGAILFLALTGRPLRPDPVSELMAGTLGRTPPAFPPTADRDLAAICSKCLSEHPAGRYGSAEALADELDRWADGRPIHTRPPRVTRRLWLWVRRRPGAAALVLLAAVLLTAGVGMVTWKWRDEAAARRDAQEKGSLAAAAVARSLMEPEADGDSRELGTAALWWVRSFEDASADAVGLQTTARANLAALSGRLHTLKDVRTGPPLRPTGEPVNAVSSEGWVAEANANCVRVSHAGRAKGEPLEHDDVVRAVAFLSNDRLLTGGDDHGARVWKFTEANGWQQVTKVEHQEYVRTIAVSPDGRLMATGGADGAAQVWDTVTFRRVGQLLPHAGWVERVAFSADGTGLTTTAADGTERVWALSDDARTGRVYKLGSDVFAVAPTADGTGVYAGAEKGLYRLDVANPATPVKPVHREITWAVAVHPRGEWVAAGGPKGQEGWFAVFRPDGKTHGPFALKHPVRSIAVTPGGSQAFVTTATATEGGTWVWDSNASDTAPQVVEQGQPAWAVAVAPNGGEFVTSTGDGRLRGRETATRAATAFSLDRPPRVVALAYHPDGRRLIGVSTEGFVRSWDTAKGEEQWSALHRGAVWAVGVSPEGKAVASGGRDRCVRVWDADTGGVAGPPLDHSKVVWAVSFSPDGKWVWSGSEDGTVRRRVSPGASLGVTDDHLHRWAERVTGVALDAGRTRPLTPDEWRSR